MFERGAKALKHFIARVDGIPFDARQASVALETPRAKTLRYFLNRSFFHTCNTT
jgi:hypothetical protein